MKKVSLALLICFCVCICSPAFASQFTKLTASVAETDPQVGSTNAGEFCTGDGSAVQCTTAGSLSDDNLGNNNIDDLLDVTITADSAAQILVRNAGDTAYENVSVSGDISITAAGVVAVSDDSHAHTSSTISGLDISADTNLAVTSPIVLTDDTLSLNQNAGTDVTSDLEEETHATEHAIGGADTVEFYGEVQDEDSALTRRRFLNFEGAGVSCADDTTKTTCTIAGAGSATFTVEEGDVSVSASINDLDFQSGFDITESPAGEANISLDLSEAASGGDITWTVNSPAVNDDSHAHTGSTLSGIDISDDTNLAGDAEIVLTGDTLSIAASIARDAEVVLDSEFPVLSTTPSDAQILIYDNADSRYENKSVSGDITITATGAVTIAANAVALTTDTTGNYVESVATTSPLAGGAAGSEGAVLTLSITDDGVDGTKLADHITIDGSQLRLGDGSTNYSQFGTNGALSYAGTAKPNRTIILTASGALLPTTNPASSTTLTGTNVSYRVLDFDAATDESAYYTFIWPDSWDAGTITARFRWQSTSTTNDVVWAIQTACVADDEAVDASLNTANTVTDTAKGTANELNDADIASVTVTGCSAGELTHIKIYRDADNGSDTMTGDARLIYTKMEYTANVESD